DLTPVIVELRDLSRAETGNTDAKHLLDLVSQATRSPASSGAGFRIAEIARDSLGAPALAGQLFLEVAASDTGSLYAPKALVAAIPLLPDRHDSIATILDTRYTAAPYTRPSHRHAGLTYAAPD